MSVIESWLVTEMRILAKQAICDQLTYTFGPLADRIRSAEYEVFVQRGRFSSTPLINFVATSSGKKFYFLSLAPPFPTFYGARSADLKHAAYTVLREAISQIAPSPV